MEFKSELFHPTKIKIELTSFENFENELFTIFIKKNFNTLELTLGTEVKTRLYSLYGNITSHGNSYNDLSSLARKALQFHF